MKSLMKKLLWPDEYDNGIVLGSGSNLDFLLQNLISSQRN